MTAASDDRGQRLRAGFIPLIDASPLIVAVERGFTTEEGLDVTLVREVSWSNVRDKLNLGQFEAAHLLAPVAISSSLGFGHVRVPIVVPFTLAMNGNAITVSSALHAEIMAAVDGNPRDPLVTARALAKVVAARRGSGAPMLTFGMTFPFSTHNYQLRYWMAAGGVDPDEDVRMVVLPPPFMVDSLANGHVDCFCVGAPWNSVAVDGGFGRILHLVSDLFKRAAEKVLGVRQSWSEANPETMAAMIRALDRAAKFIAEPANHGEVAELLSRPDLIGVDPEVILRTLVGRLKVDPDGSVMDDPRYMLVGREGAARPEPLQAAWLYAQMVRWGQATQSAEALTIARQVFRPDIYDAAVGKPAALAGNLPADGMGAFAGPAFDQNDIEGYLAALDKSR